MYVMYAVMFMIRRLVIRTMELRLEPVLKICRTAGFARNAELVRIRSLRRNKIRITEIKKSLSLRQGLFFALLFGKDLAEIEFGSQSGNNFGLSSAHRFCSSFGKIVLTGGVQ